MAAVSIPTLPVERLELDNGLRVVLQQDASLPLVAVNLWYHVGSKDERPGLTGLAHLFEHMLFQGSENVGANDHFRLVQQVGGVANGSTWFDRTNYYETLPAHCLDLALWLESDRMGFLLPALDSDKLETQRNVVMNERQQRIDNQPYGRAFERLHELLYPEDHPYHWPVIGAMDDIAAATLEDVESFFRTYYAPNNAVLTLVGDFPPEHARQRIQHYFASIPAGENIPSLPTSVANRSSPSYEVMEDEVQLARIYLAVRMPPFGDPRWYAGDLLGTVLSGGKSSLLYRDLVYSRQIATDVSAFLLPTELAATFAVVVTAKPDTTIDELHDSLQRLLLQAKAGPTQSELERAQNRVVTALCDQLQKLEDRADLLSMYTTLFDDPDRLHREADAYLRLRASDLAEAATDFLDVNRQSVLAIVPKTRS